MNGFWFSKLEASWRTSTDFLVQGTWVVLEPRSDDEISDLMVKCLPEGVRHHWCDQWRDMSVFFICTHRLTGIMDCCNNLRYCWKTHVARFVRDLCPERDKQAKIVNVQWAPWQLKSEEFRMEQFESSAQVLSLRFCIWGHSGTGLDLPFTWDPHRGMWREAVNPLLAWNPAIKGIVSVWGEDIEKIALLRWIWSQAGELLCEQHPILPNPMCCKRTIKILNPPARNWSPDFLPNSKLGLTGLMVPGTIPWGTFSCSAAWAALLCCVDKTNVYKWFVKKVLDGRYK